MELSGILTRLIKYNEQRKLLTCSCAQPGHDVQSAGWTGTAYLRQPADPASATPEWLYPAQRTNQFNELAAAEEQNILYAFYVQHINGTKGSTDIVKPKTILVFVIIHKIRQGLSN
jgi:hypothetical protein